ncbi:MAG: hypothetical protein RLZ10_209 [Bacteroidota bacterium]|jgi:hypothetical protein
MIINKIKTPRFISYYVDLISDNLEGLVYESESYEAFKLKIKQRHFETETGELNFMIRDKSNNLRHILLYCYMDKPDEINSFEYYINDTVKLPSKQNIKVGNLLDDEMAELFVKDLIHNHIKNKYKII